MTQTSPCPEFEATMRGTFDQMIEAVNDAAHALAAAPPPNGLIQFVKSDLAPLAREHRPARHRLWRDTVSTEIAMRAGGLRSAQTRIDPYRAWCSQWSGEELKAAREWLSRDRVRLT